LASKQRKRTPPGARKASFSLCRLNFPLFCIEENTF
jgi:hypothetical protein